jgi:hypothetical protein
LFSLKINQGAMVCQVIQNGHKFAVPKALMMPEEAKSLRV